MLRSSERIIENPNQIAYILMNVRGLWRPPMEQVHQSKVERKSMPVDDDVLVMKIPVILP